MQNIKGIFFSPLEKPEEMLTVKTRVDPGNSISDILVFDLPDRMVHSVYLHFPAKIFGGSSIVRFEIPYQFEPPEKPELK
jgi:hypothetical protein